jgi:phage baseplate assembly protein W
MEADFLGRGWAFPIGVNHRGGIALAPGESDIEQSIRIILETAPGERVMRPEFGCGLHRLVFAPNSPTTAGLVAYHVREALGRWEPRVDIENVDVSADPHRDAVLLIEIQYRIRSTNDRRNLVYPFYRIPEEE